MTGNFAEEMSLRITTEFLGEVKYKTISPDLTDGQKPEPFLLQTTFELPPSYFWEGGLPEMFKKDEKEDQEEHIERVRYYLLEAPADVFTNYAKLIDSKDVHQRGFFELYTEVTKQRANRNLENVNPQKIDEMP